MRKTSMWAVVTTTVAAISAILAPPAWSDTFRLEDATVADIQAALDAEVLTSVDLVQLYLNRIEAYDSDGPAINSLITVNPEALAIAAEMDAARSEGNIMGPLHGIPIILKDNYDTLDLPTTAGSDVLADSVPSDDAFVVERLRAAGAIIIGKSNMSEFASSDGRLGYSSMGGLTLNPYNLGRNASGSSSGTAAAIAANFAAIGTGSDTAGSIRGPSAVTSLVGIKPTRSLISLDGIVPLTLSFDVAGPMARYVADAALLLEVMAAADPSEPAIVDSDPGAMYDYTTYLDPNALEGARLGLITDFTAGNPDVEVLMADAIAQLEALGATVVELDFPASLESPWDYMALPWVHEFGPQIESYLATLPDGFPETLEELIDASSTPAIANSDTPVNPARMDSFQASLEADGLASLEMLYVLSYQMPGVRQTLLEIMKDNEINAFIYPTLPCPASPIYTVESDPTYTCTVSDPYSAGYFANITGFPDITVPMGFTELGLPAGISFLAEAFSEPKLIGYAYAYEQASQLRQPPALTPPLAGEEIDY